MASRLFTRAAPRVIRLSAPAPARHITTESAQKSAEKALGTAKESAEKAFAGAKKLGGSLGETAGNLLGSYREPITYNFAVFREILKQVYIAERLAPPSSLSEITSAYSTIWSRASNPAYWRELLATGGWAKVGIYSVEAWAIWHIGEIIGRRSLVGYKLD